VRLKCRLNCWEMSVDGMVPFDVRVVFGACWQCGLTCVSEKAVQLRFGTFLKQRRMDLKYFALPYMLMDIGSQV